MLDEARYCFSPWLDAAAAASRDSASRSVWLVGRDFGADDEWTWQSQLVAERAASGLSAADAVDGDF